MARNITRHDDVRDLPEYKKRYARDHKPVKARFINHESPGGTLRFNFKRYDTCSSSLITFKDGEVYDTTLMIYEHINNTCRYQIHSYEIDEATGKPSIRVGRWIPRFSMVPILYTDETMEAGPSQDLITVEKLC